VLAYLDYQRKIEVSASADTAYRALTKEFGSWWTRTVTVFDRVGDHVTFKFPPQESFWIFEATRLEQGRCVELLCIEAHHLIADKPKADREEWLGTRIEWLIEPAGEMTAITFRHDGLKPDLDCWEVCEAGWNHFFVGSLQSYLNNGQGMPHGA